jgi:hypothetical protein
MGSKIFRGHYLETSLDPIHNDEIGSWIEKGVGAMSGATNIYRLPDRGVRSTEGSAVAPAMFPPDRWYFDPVSRAGLPYDRVRPCSCGCTRFLFVTRGVSDRDHSVVCEACYQGPFKYRLWRKHDLVYATLDTRTKTVTPTRPVAEVLALRARMPKS